MHLREPGCRVVFAGGAAIPLLHIRRTPRKRNGGDSLFGGLYHAAAPSNALKRRVATVAPKAPPKDSAL